MRLLSANDGKVELSFSWISLYYGYLKRPMDLRMPVLFLCSQEKQNRSVMRYIKEGRQNLWIL